MKKKVDRESGETNGINPQLAAVVADHLQNLFDLPDETRMVHWFSQLDVAEVTRTVAHRLGACLAFESSIDGAQQRVVETAVARFCASFVHSFGVKNVANTHAFDLLGGH